MPMTIALLEDNEGRKAVMRSCVADRFHTYEIRLFDEPATMIHFLQEHLGVLVQREVEGFGRFVSALR